MSRRLLKRSSYAMFQYAQVDSSRERIGSSAVQMTFSCESTTTIPPKRLPPSKHIPTTFARSSFTPHNLSYSPLPMT